MTKIRQMFGVGALAAAILLAFAAGAQTPAPKPAPLGEPEVAVKGLVEDPYESARQGAPVAAGAKSKSYSPYAGRNYPTRVFFGDTHHHTSNSGDAFAGGNRLGPEQAYRLARGEEVVTSTGIAAKMGRPLDFLVISDHAEGLGIMTQVYPGSEVKYHRDNHLRAQYLQILHDLQADARSRGNPKKSARGGKIVRRKSSNHLPREKPGDEKFAVLPALVPGHIWIGTASEEFLGRE